MKMAAQWALFKLIRPTLGWQRREQRLDMGLGPSAAINSDLLLGKKSAYLGHL